MQIYAQIATSGADMIKWIRKMFKYTKTINFLMKLILVHEAEALFLEEYNFRVEGNSRLPSLKTCYIGLQIVRAKCFLN